MSKNTRELNSTHAVAVESFLLWLSVRTKKTREQLLEENAVPLIISAVAGRKPDLKSPALYLLAEIELKHPGALVKHDALWFIFDKPRPENSTIHTDDYKQPSVSYLMQIESARKEVIMKLAPQLFKWLAASDANSTEESWLDEIVCKCPQEFVEFLLGPEMRGADEAFSLAKKIDPTTLGDRTLALIVSEIRKEPGAEICQALKVQLSQSLQNDPKNSKIEEALRAAGEEPLEHYLNFLMNSRLDMRHLERISELIVEKPQDKLSHKALFKMLNTIRKTGVWKDRAERYDLMAKGQHSNSSHDAEIEEMQENETAGKIANAVREVVAANPKLKARIEEVVIGCAAKMDDRTWKFIGSVALALDMGIIEKLQKMELSSNEKTRTTQLFALCHFATNSKIRLPIERIQDYVWLLSNSKPEDVDREVCMRAFKAIAEGNKGDGRLVALVSPILELAQYDRTKAAMNMFASIGPAVVVPLLDEYARHPEKAAAIMQALEAIKSHGYKVDTGVVAKTAKPEDLQNILKNLALDIGKQQNPNTTLRMRT